MKFKHSVIYLAFIAIPIIPAIMGTFNYLQNLELLKSGWYSLWTQITLFYASFFYAPLIGIYCSYTWRLEHTHNNWNHFMSMPVSIFDSCVHHESDRFHTDLGQHPLLYQRQTGGTSRHLFSGDHFLADPRNAGSHRHRLPAASPIHADTELCHPDRHRSVREHRGHVDEQCGSR